MRHCGTGPCFASVQRRARMSAREMKNTIHLIVSLAIVAITAGCEDGTGRPTSPDSVPTVAVATTPDFTGIWIGVSRVISCEHSAEGCEGYPVGHMRYLDFRLTQSGDDVTGNLSPTKGGPTALPAVFWVSGRVTSGKLAFEPMDVPGASGGLFSYSGELMLTSSSAGDMFGRMTERATGRSGALTIMWEVRTTRLARP